MNERMNLRRSKKARLYIIGGLLLVVVLLGIFVESLRIWMIGIGIVLLAAFGLEVANTDVDLGSVMEGNSISDSVIERDEAGNLQADEEGSLVPRLLRNREGEVVPEGTEGAKYTDEYNCDDFETQPEAQRFFEAAGGIEGDVNRLDGNKDGVACQALPQGSN
jgi:hypothetical protein